jgi:hypothetical protein
MTSRDFVYWLQGYFEILDPKNQGGALPLGPMQAQCIREHLALVFKHELAPKPAAYPVGTTMPQPKVKVVPPYHTETFDKTAQKHWQDLMQSAKPIDQQSWLTGTWDGDLKFC